MYALLLILLLLLIFINETLSSNNHWRPERLPMTKARGLFRMCVLFHDTEHVSNPRVNHPVSLTPGTGVRACDSRFVPETSLNSRLWIITHFEFGEEFSFFPHKLNDYAVKYRNNLERTNTLLASQMFHPTNLHGRETIGSREDHKMPQKKVIQLQK
jgi:hypothetical protein